jgi:soluble lytic murein transglycosylase-like protein
MQIMPFWLKEFGNERQNLLDEATNIKIGCAILKYYLEHEHGDLVKALSRYNGTHHAQYAYKVIDTYYEYWTLAQA